MTGNRKSILILVCISLLIFPDHCKCSDESESETEPDSSEEGVNDIESVEELSDLLNLNSTVPNHRDSRQLISLLKTFLNSGINSGHQKSPEINQGPVNPFPQYLAHNQPMQNPYESATSNLNQPFQLQQQQQQQYPPAFYPSSVEQKIHSANINPSYQHNYPMLNYPTQSHSSIPHYNPENLLQQQQQQAQSQQIFQQALPQSGSGSGPVSQNSLLSLLSSVLSGGPAASSSSSTSANSNAKLGTMMLSKLGLLGDDLDLFGLLNFASLDGMVDRVNRFDKLQCIPRMICQMVSKRNEDALLRIKETTTSTTTTTTERSSKKNKKKGSRRGGKLIKIDGLNTAVDQFVKFLDLMQLKDWSLYPYVKGLYEGNQARTPTECADRFRTCPFSEDQLVYYFNNYNGGFFQNFRSGRNEKGEFFETVSSNSKE